MPTSVGGTEIGQTPDALAADAQEVALFCVKNPDHI